MKGNEGPAGPPGPAVSLEFPGDSGQEPGKGLGREDSGQVVAGTMGLHMRGNSG